MTSGGAYRPFNRHGMQDGTSPLQQISYETATDFLKTAVLEGNISSFYGLVLTLHNRIFKFRKNGLPQVTVITASGWTARPGRHRLLRAPAQTVLTWCAVLPLVLSVVGGFNTNSDVPDSDLHPFHSSLLQFF